MSAGLDYPGVGPEHSWLRDTGRASYRAITDAAGHGRVLAAVPDRGHHPGDRVGARAGRRARSWAASWNPAALLLVNLSGRGDKDVDIAARWFGHLDAGGRAREPAVTVAFDKASADGRAALVGYLPAGFPTVDGAIDAAVAMAQAGADVIEIGLPYSDPLMDGPVIQEATQRALAGGTRVTDVLRTVEAVAAAGVPVLVMTYWNPVDHYGVAAFARDLAAAGGAGLITPDLPPEEAADWLEASDGCGLDRVFLVAPSSPDERIARITAACRGFVYAASLMGTTGARTRRHRSRRAGRAGSARPPACRSPSAWASATAPRPPR